MSRCFCPQFRSTQRPAKGFTLVEVAVAMAVIGIFVAGGVLALLQMNRFAAVSRLQTLAQGLAQQRIDEILATSWTLGNPRPTALVAGTRTDNNLPLNNDPFNSRAGLKSLFTDLDVQVDATRTSTITDLTPRQLSALVIVRFNFRGRPYQVTMTTLRTTDNI